MSLLEGGSHGLERGFPLPMVLLGTDVPLLGCSFCTWPHQGGPVSLLEGSLCLWPF